MTSTVEIEYVELDSGAIALIPSQLWLNAAAAKPDSEESLNQLQGYLETARKSPGYRSLQCTFRHYTHGDEMKAKRKGTTLTVNGPIVDAAVVHHELLKVSFGWTDEFLDSLRPELVEAAVWEMEHRMRPTQEMVDFFVFKRTTLPETASSTVQEPDAAK